MVSIFQTAISAASIFNLMISLFFFTSGLTESLFLSHKDDYPEHEQASLRQLYQAKVDSFVE